MPKIKTSKEEVIAKLIPVIRERGVSLSSMSQLAEACDIQKSHFYYYFKNKEQLIKEVLITVHNYFSYQLNKILSKKHSSLSEKMDALENLLNKIFLDSKGGCIMANTALETLFLSPIYQQDIKNFFQEFLEGIRTLLTHRYSNHEAQELSEQIVQDIEGGILLMRVYDNRKYLDKALERARNILLKK